jgi:hypothetical protein
VAVVRGDCNRVLVQGLERSCQGASLEHVLRSANAPYRISIQDEHAGRGHSVVACLSTAQQAEQVIHTRSAERRVLQEQPHSPQPTLAPGPKPDADVSRVSYKRMNSHQLMHHHSLPAELPAVPPLSCKASTQQEADQDSMCRSIHDMTLHDWTQADPKQSRQCDTMRSRRRCMRGDSAESWLSTCEHAASARHHSSRIPHPPRHRMRPYADLAPLLMTRHTNLPTVKRREKEYAEELNSFEREFQELDSDPEVLAMIKQKSDVPRADPSGPVVSWVPWLLSEQSPSCVGATGKGDPVDGKISLPKHQHSGSRAFSAKSTSGFAPQVRQAHQCHCMSQKGMPLLSVCPSSALSPVVL